MEEVFTSSNITKFYDLEEDLDSLNISKDNSDLEEKPDLEENSDSFFTDLFKKTKDYVKLGATQKKAFELFEKGENVCILGSSGMGKSLLVKTIKDYVTNYQKHKNIAITSTTGISAYNISGVTIHSYIGMGTGEKDVYAIISAIKRYGNVERLQKLDILVIDEISMLSAEIFEKLDRILKIIRNKTAFFGGIQVICTGDLLQLLPVFSKGYSTTKKEQDTRLLVESEIFNKIFTKSNTIVLKENFRQKGDDEYFKILSNIRYGIQTVSDIEAINKRKIATNNDAVVLVSTNKKASYINDNSISKITGTPVKYKAIYSTTGKSKEVCETLRKEIQTQFKARNIDEMILKIGARVMLIKNIDTAIGLVNGATGIIVGIEKTKEVLVRFDNGNQVFISPEVWNIEIDHCIVTANQIPLMLAYALTIHKVQSLTLDTAILDIGDCFCEHQVFVALSRLRSLKGLYIKTFNPKKITVNTVMKNFLENLEK